MLTHTTNSLIKIIHDGTDAEINAAAKAFFDAVNDASRDDANASLRILSTHFNHENPSKGAFIALLCGALIEQGCDPMTISQALIERLASLLKLSAELANTCIEKIPESDDEDENSIEVFEKTRQQGASTMVEQNAAWEALEQFWRPAIAVFSISAESRSSARHLCDFAGQIAEQVQPGT